MRRFSISKKKLRFFQIVPIFKTGKVFSIQSIGNLANTFIKAAAEKTPTSAKQVGDESAISAAAVLRYK